MRRTAHTQIKLNRVDLASDSISHLHWLIQLDVVILSIYAYYSLHVVHNEIYARLPGESGSHSERSFV